MSGYIAFPLSDGQILTIRIARETNLIDLDGIRDGSILWGFDAFLDHKIARNKFCEEILAWPYRHRGTARNVRLEVSAIKQYRGTNGYWLGESFGLATVIAFARSQSDTNLTHWPTVIATGVMRRDTDHLLIDQVQDGDSFSQKLLAVQNCTQPPEYFIFPLGQVLTDDQKILLEKLQNKGTNVLEVNSLLEVCEHGICPAAPAQDTKNVAFANSGNHKASISATRDTPVSNPYGTGKSRGVFALTFIGFAAIATYLLLPQFMERTNNPTVQTKGSTSPAPNTLSPNTIELRNILSEHMGTNGLIAEKDEDGDSVPDRTELIDGTDPKNSASFKDTDNDGVPDLFEPLEIGIEYFKRYQLSTNHRALASYSSATTGSHPGGYSFISGRTSAISAARLALDGCLILNKKSTDKHQCRVVNVDGIWIKDLNPPELQDDKITEKTAATALEQYETQSNNKVFVYSLGGRHSMDFGKKQSAETLSEDLLQDCRDKNKFWEIKYPCRIISINGQQQN